MANHESSNLDNIIASRRAMLLGGGAALAALAMPKAAHAALTPTTVTDNDILNFALNLEYLEANFYYMAAFGCTIDAPNAAAQAAGAPSAGIGIGTGTTATGTSATVTGATAVPFVSAAIKAYAIETAIEEGKHVLFLRNALGSAAVAQPAINLTPTTFNALATAAGVNTAALINGGIFNPYASDFAFLGGAYIFEDVGVTAYTGAAPLISSAGIKAGLLQAAASIQAVEAYHAGLIRSTIYQADPSNASGVLTATQKVAQFRATAAHGVAPSGQTFPQAGAAYADDFGLYPGTYPQDSGTTPGVTANPPATGTVSLQGGAGVSASNIADAEPMFVIAYGRTTTQVLNIVTAGGAATSGSKAQGGFFPSGLNGTLA